MEPNTFLMAADTANQNEWLWGLWTLPVFLLAIFWAAAVVSILRSSYHWSMKVLAALGRECPILCVRGFGLQIVRESVGVCHG